MASSTNFFDSILNIQPSALTRTIFGGARDVSNSDDRIGPMSDDPSYKWVDPRVLDTLTYFRGPNDLDKFLSKVSFLKPDSPLDAVVVDICGYTDRVCHGLDSAPQDFSFVCNTFFTDLHVTLPLDEFTMGVLRILNKEPTQLHINSWATLQAFRIL